MMLRTFLFFLALTASMVAHAADTPPRWVYKTGEGDVTVVIVGVQYYRTEFGLNEIRGDVNDRATTIAQELAQWEDVGNIAYIQSADAAKADVTRIVESMPATPRILLVWVGLGTGRDAGEACVLPADAVLADLATGFTPLELKRLLMSKGSQVDVILDVTVAKPYQDWLLAGPDAVDFLKDSCPSCAYVTSTAGNNAPPSDAFMNEVAAALKEAREQGKAITYGQIQAGFLQGGWSTSMQFQGAVNAGDMFLAHPGAPAFTVVADPVLVGTPDPLPTQPPPPRRRIEQKTWALGAAGAVLTATSVASGLLLNETMQSMATDEAIRANYANDAELQTAEDMRPVYGWCMVGAGIGAAAAFAGAAVTFAF